MEILTRYNVKTYVEIPVFLVMVSITLTDAVFTNLIIFRTCYVNLGYDKSECALLETENRNSTLVKLEEDVQPLSNTISMVLSLPTGIICSISTLFIGAWSDKFGRKPVMILSLSGILIAQFLIILFNFFPELSSWYLLVKAVPEILSGGYPALLTACITYVTDVTDENIRGVRMGIFEIAVSIGGLLGTISSSFIFKAIGFNGVFTLSTACFLLALLYTVYILEEPVKVELSQGRFENFFERNHIESMLVATFKKRDGNERGIILLCILISSLYIFAINGAGACTYLFLRLKFDWNLKDYTYFMSYRDTLSIIGAFFGVYGLHKMLKVDEVIVMLIGLLSCLNYTLVQGLATSNFHIYFGGGLRFLSKNVSPMLRSIISKTAKSDEIGRIFSCLIMCEILLQIIGAPIYTFVYNVTLETRPEFFNFLASVILIFAIFGTLILGLFWMRKREDEEVISNLIIDEDCSDSIEN